jgi:hypothetical protein
LENEELELFERAARALAERARRDAEGAKGTSVERIHGRTQAGFLRMAERIKQLGRRPIRSDRRRTCARYGVEKRSLPG